MSDKDPFAEHARATFRKQVHILGGAFEFTGDNERLLRLVSEAYAGLHPHRLSKSMPRFQIRLQLASGSNFSSKREPPRIRTQGDGKFLCGIMDAANFAIVCPQLRSGLISISKELLRFPYHARYELLEFAVVTLASRALNLAPLHAGCVGLRGDGLLLIGESGAGKSTLALQAMLQGMDFLAEDAVFIAPDSLLAAGVANHLHLREDGLCFIDTPPVAARVRKSPTIRRRSGVEKFEVDLRHKSFRRARTPLKLVGVVFVTRKPAAGRAILEPIGSAESLARFAASQPYASQLPSGKQLMRKLPGIGAFELRRTKHPREAAAALRGLLQWGQWRR